MEEVPEVEKNLKLAYHIVNTYFPAFRGDEDIYQVAVIGLIKAARSYKSTEGKFSTWAGVCIQNEIKMELRKRKKFYSEVSVETALAEDADGHQMTIEQLLIQEAYVDDRILADEIIDIIKTTLTAKELKVFLLLWQGSSQVEIGNQLGFTQSYISRVRAKIHRKLTKKYKLAISI